MRLFTILGICAIGWAPIHGQDSISDVATQVARRPPLKPDAVLDALEERARVVRDRLQHPARRQDIESASLELRRHLTESLGSRLLPWPPQLRSATTGTIQGQGYHVEKVVFQSLPDVIVPAHLYVPDGLTAPAPAVLFAVGYSRNEGKALPETQAFCINMARFGFIVLAADPIGVGERAFESDLHHPELLLAGLSYPGIIEYETQCALEYLRSRKDVDGARLGMTGTDGGGFNTWITAALDQRLAAVAPVDDTFDFFDRIRETRAPDRDGWDEREVIPGILKYANIQELVAMMAPRPLLMMMSADPQQIYEYGRTIYGSFAASDQIRQLESESSGYTAMRRRAAYGFFLRALMNRGDGAPVSEPDTRTLPPTAPEQRCLPTDYHASAGPGISETISRVAAGIPAPGNGIPEDVLGTAPERGEASYRLGEFAISRQNITTERGIAIPITALLPGGPSPYAGARRAGTLIAIDDLDKETFASDPIVTEALRRDWWIIEADPRGFGELKIRKPGWAFTASVLLGDNFVLDQAWDIRYLLDALETSSDRPFAIYARGPNASLVVAYLLGLSLSDDHLDLAVVRGGLTSLRQLLDGNLLATAAGDQAISYAYSAFGQLGVADLPKLLSASRAKTFLIDPISAQVDPAPRSGKLRVISLDEFIKSNW